MSTTHPAHHSAGSPTAGRAVGYAFAALANIFLLFLINVWPGWQDFGFLTAAAGELLPLVNVSLIVGMLFNAFYLISDPTWLRGLGDAVGAALSLVILLLLLAEWPFTLPNEGVEIGLRIGLIIGAFGAFVAVVAGIVRFAKGLLPQAER